MKIGILLVDDTMNVLLFQSEEEQPYGPFYKDFSAIEEINEVLPICLGITCSAIDLSAPIYYSLEQQCPVYISYSDLKDHVKPNNYIDSLIFKFERALALQGEIPAILRNSYNTIVSTKSLYALRREGYPQECCMYGENKCITSRLDGKIFVDKCLAQEISKLHKLGFTTTSSCCGHDVSKGSITIKGSVAELVERHGYQALSKNSVVPQSKMLKNTKFKGGIF